MGTWYHAVTLPENPAVSVKRLADTYTKMRSAVLEFEQCQATCNFTEQGRKDLDLAHVCLRLGYKRIKKVLKRHGATFEKQRANLRAV